MKSKEDCYNEAAFKSLRSDLQGTGQDVISLAMDIYAEQFKGMPKIKIEEHKIDSQDEYFYIASLEGIRGMIVEAQTKEQAIEELLISFKSKLLYDYNKAS